MDWKQQYLSKGFYQHTQVGNPVSVKNYIFLRNNNKKYLLIRYANELDHTVHEMYMTLVQLDAAGKTITNTKLQYKDLQFLPGSTFAENAGILVDEKCTDFRVIIQKVISGQYEYSTYAGEPIVRYIKRSKDLGLKTPLRANISAPKVRKRTFGKPVLSVVLATLAVLAMIVVNVYGAFADYRDMKIAEAQAKAEAEAQQTETSVSEQE